jgi:hypothetical protein
VSPLYRGSINPERKRSFERRRFMWDVPSSKITFSQHYYNVPVVGDLFMNLFIEFLFRVYVTISR